MLYGILVYSPVAFIAISNGFKGYTEKTSWSFALDDFIAIHKAILN